MIYRGTGLLNSCRITTHNKKKNKTTKQDKKNKEQYQTFRHVL